MMARAFRCFTILVLLVGPSAVWAHVLDAGFEPDGGADPAHLVEAPVLTHGAVAVYPSDELRAGREDHVHLELLVDDLGRVEDVRILESGGAAFDSAAVEAARQYEYRPARDEAGHPMRALLRTTIEFRLPTKDRGEARSGPMTTVVTASRPISAASSSSVRDRDFALRPIGSVQDVLRITPGLTLVQHSGGGKANQYFLRGFDADHGTDVALSIDGVPINLPSHAHGQGYADTNFIIPEVVERVEITKGPYFANQGDYATAGSIGLISRESFEHSSIGLGYTQSPGHGVPSGRALVIASPTFEAVRATFAAELGQANGPFEHPDTWNRYKLFNRITVPLSASSSLSLIHMGYGGDWSGSGQLPERAVEAGTVSRFGSLDPTEGGSTTRQQLALSYRIRPDEKSELRAMAYVAAYQFNLFSNFTFFLNDPVNGDQIEQSDRRMISGAKVSYRVVNRLGDLRLDTTIGADIRDDDLQNRLFHTQARAELATLRNNRINETLGGAFINEEVTPFRWLRFDLGGRADVITFAVDDLLTSPDPTAPRAGVGSAYQLSPKASVVVTPLQREGAQLELYANYGHGFHSNDVRGVFSTPAVTPLARAVGEELGARVRLFDRWDLAAAAWMLDLASETVWNGDEGTTGVSGATKRYGGEVETRVELLPWLAADLDLTFTHSQFSTDQSNGGGLALAPRLTWAGGLSARHELGPGIARGGLRVYGIGNRPASDDGVLVAPGFTQVDLHLGWRHRRVDLALDIENLLDGAFRSAQFATTSRLAGEPAIGAPAGGASCGSHGRLAASPTGADDGLFHGCEDVSFTPALPLTMRLTATLFLD